MREYAKHEHIGDEHDHAGQAEDMTRRERPLDLAAVRAKLQSKTGRQYWRTLEELAEDPKFEELLHRDFPDAAALRSNTSFRTSSNRTAWSLASLSFMRPRCPLGPMPSAFWSKAMKGGPRKSKAIQTIHRASALRTHLPRLRS